MDIQIGGRAKSLDERDRTGLGFTALGARLLDQKGRDDPMHDLQHRCLSE